MPSYQPFTMSLLAIYAARNSHLRSERSMTTPLFTRRIRPIVVEALRDSRIVLISGARQVGKTTLSTEIAATDHPMRTLTLDNGPTREAALRDPAGFIAGLDGPVLIDEIQRAPELLLEIKRAVDRDTTPGRFLLTVQAYVTLLEQMFLVQRLPAWRPGLGARESSRPKVYVCDPGMLAYLLGADIERIEHDDQVTGKACETLVAAELLKHASWATRSIRAYHYQREREDIDFVLESRAGDLAAIEVKAKASLRSTDWKWLAALRDARGDRFKSGIVVYSGEQTIPLGDRLWAVPYAGLWA
jgi:predicted AAA+ superfamily ATPase